MSFYDFLKSLQSQPDNQKKKWLVGLTIAAALVLGTFWVINVKDKFTSRGSLLSLQAPQQEENKTDSVTKENIAGPFKSLGRGVSLFVADIRKQSTELFPQTNEIVSESPNRSVRRPVYRLPIVKQIRNF